MSRDSQAEGSAEFSKILSAFFDDLAQNVDLQFLVLMDCDVSKTHHSAHLPCELRADLPSIAKQVEGLCAALRDAQMFECDHMHSEIDGGLAGALKVEDYCVLMGEISQSLGIAGVLLNDAAQAAFNDACLI